MFIQEPFWYLTLRLPNARYIAVNNKYNFLPRALEDRGMVIVEDLARVLADARKLNGQDAQKPHPAGGSHVTD